MTARVMLVNMGNGPHRDYGEGLPAQRAAPYPLCATVTALTQGFTLGSAVAPFQGAQEMHAGAAEPLRVAPP